MGTILARRSAWGLDSYAQDDTAWRMRAACRGDYRFTDGPFGNAGDRRRNARVMIHTCRAHCAVIRECSVDAMVARPIGVVQAGIFWADWDHRPPHILSDLGCGAHCDGQPAVHGGVS